MTKKICPSLFWTLVVFLWIQGCATTRPTKSTTVSLQQDASLKAGQVEPKARTLFLHAEKAYREQNYRQAIESYRAIKARHPGTYAHEIASYRLGSILYLLSQYPAASAEFQSFLGLFPQSELTFDVVYNYAASEFQQGHYAKTLESLRRLPPERVRSQSPKRAEVVYVLGVQAAAAANQPVPGVLFAAGHLQLPLENSNRRAVENTVVKQLSLISSTDDLSALAAQVTEPFTRARIAERLASLNPSAIGQPGIPAPAPTLSTSSGTGDASHLGVVLPLTGPLANYGRKALDAILLATSAFGKGGSGSRFEVFVEDSASNPALAAQGVERLYDEHNVVAVIGPIAWRESLAAADKAQALGVPNLSLAGKEGISERGAYLFQNALTPRVQVENLVKYCIQERGFRRFAILAPGNAFGDDMAREFAAVSERLNGQIVGYQTYPPDAKDFQTEVKKLVGLDDFRYRRMEYAKLDQFMKEQQQKTRRPSKARLPPIVDFDAVFLPDSPRIAAQIAASLNYYDVSGVTLLGISEWNTDQLYKRGGRLMEGALFPGALSLTSSNARQRHFVRLYTDAYGSMPDLLAAQAYEAVELIAHAIDAGSGNRNSVVQELLAIERFEGPLGQLSFDSSRITLRSLPILSLEPGGNIVER